MKPQIATAALIVLVGVSCLGASAASKTNARDRQFILNTAQAGMTEVELGNVALKNSENPEVRDFAQQMIQDHTRAGESLKKIARDKEINVPDVLNSDKQKVVNSMKTLKGKQFDKAYSNKMVADHQKVADSLQAQAKRPDKDLKMWSEQTLPTIKHHLEMAHSMKGKVM